MTAPQVSPDVLVKANALLNALMAGAITELRAGRGNIEIDKLGAFFKGQYYRADKMEELGIAAIVAAAFLRAREKANG